MAPDILWQGMLIYIQEVFWIEDQGEGTSLRCALYFSYFRTSFSFSLGLGEWDHFTRRTETFQKISNMYGYFLYILHCMDFSVNFRWWGEGGMVTAPGPSCGPSAQGVNPPVCCVLAVTYVRGSFVVWLCKRQTSWHRAYNWWCLSYLSTLKQNLWKRTWSLASRNNFSLPLWSPFPVCIWPVYTRLYPPSFKHLLWPDGAVWVLQWTMVCHCCRLNNPGRNALIFTETDIGCYSLCELVQIVWSSFKNTPIRKGWDRLLKPALSHWSIFLQSLLHV